MNISTTKQTNFFNFCEACQRNCCFKARPPLTKARMRIIEEHLHEKGSQLRIHADEYCYPEEQEDGYCSLHNRVTRQCIVHQVKPETCVAGPITFDINLRTKKIEWYLKTEKICSLAGAMAKDSRLLSQHFPFAKREILRLVEELGQAKLLAILKIEEEDTIKIGEDDLQSTIRQKLDI